MSSNENIVVGVPDNDGHNGMATSEARCMCKDRALSDCPGEWEPGCDMGNNPDYVSAADEQVKKPPGVSWRPVLVGLAGSTPRL